MCRFHHYDPEQMYLLPPSVVEVLSEEHLYFHVHRVLEGLGGFSYGKFVAEALAGQIG